MHVDYRFDGYFAEAKPPAARRDRACASPTRGHWSATLGVALTLWCSIFGVGAAIVLALGSN